MTGQNDRQTQILSEAVILAEHWPVTGRYFEPLTYECKTFHNSYERRILPVSRWKQAETLAHE